VGHHHLEHRRHHLHPLRFPGQYHDPETGLHYNHHRYYDPTTAHYLTPDPLGLTPAPNPTTYPHNPHTWTDSLGLSGCNGPTDADAVPGIVFRALARGEDPALGLTARDPSAIKVTPLSHVAGTKMSPWISTTKLPDTAFNKYNDGHGVVAIDLSKIPNKIEDVSEGFPGKGRFDFYAKRDGEVLIFKHVPPEAIIGVWP
jgi:RHS repeat-associated protein